MTYLHQPPTDANLAVLEEGQHPCQLRLILEELLAHQLSMYRLRQSIRRHSAPAIQTLGPSHDRILEQLPFKPTGAQTRVLQETHQDLSQPVPMLRLVQGDVGSGKTLVAALAAADKDAEAGWA